VSLRLTIIREIINSRVSNQVLNENVIVLLFDLEDSSSESSHVVLKLKRKID